MICVTCGVVYFVAFVVVLCQKYLLCLIIIRFSLLFYNHSTYVFFNIFMFVFLFHMIFFLFC